MTNSKSKRHEIEMILLAMKSGEYALHVATDKLLELLDRKNELRDKFAAAALQAIIAKIPHQMVTEGETHPMRVEAARGAYDYADAMLKARAA